MDKITQKLQESDYQTMNKAFRRHSCGNGAQIATGELAPSKKKLEITLGIKFLASFTLACIKESIKSV